ncbi:MAG: HEAT repeat domain-containing protein [Solirubrobacteraceae bacterium]
MVLGRRADPPACAPLVASLAAHADDPEFLATAAWSLGQIGDATAIPALIDLARRSFLKSRLAAVEALAQWPSRPEVRRTLGLARHDRSELVREAAERLLATLAPPGGQPAD